MSVLDGYMGCVGCRLYNPRLCGYMGCVVITLGCSARYGGNPRLCRL